MPRFAFFLFLFACFSFSSCDKRTRIDLPFRAYVDIPAGLNTGLSHHFVLSGIPGIDEGNIVEALPATITLTIESGESSFDFVQRAYLSTYDNGTRQEMAYREDLPIANHSSIQLYPSILNMKDHIIQDEFQIELKMIFRAIPITTTRVRIDFVAQGILGD